LRLRRKTPSRFGSTEAARLGDESLRARHSVEWADGSISIDSGRCAEYGACAGACSHGTIELVNGVAQLDDD
jgi:hypothetical protein